MMVVNMLKNMSHRYSSHYIIKFIGFTPIYYVIDLNIVTSRFLAICILYLSIYCKFESIILSFLSKKMYNTFQKENNV